MGCHVTLTLLFVGWSLSSCSPPRMYYQVNQPMTWLQAQNFCKEHYTDLATFESHDDIRMLEPTIPDRSWFGLFDDPKSWQENLGNESNSWRWSVTGETGKTTFKAWASGEPSYSNGNEVCVIMNPDGTWADTNCLIGYTFVCYTVTTLKTTVGMQIRTDADMTDPAVMEHFLQQIHIRLTNLGFTDFKLQWKNLPSNQTKKT
uniref:C-type lectin mannose-binding isoform-like isoform X2 n=1 Tax=Solea senegalensis TaxID=28829 RepID=UPI001CD825C0|nr:C-type lectin mannose-binding isoform-like isoform X2 [Solea senegalensis]